MTDLSHQGHTLPADQPFWSRWPWPLSPYVCVLLSGFAGLHVGHALGSNAAAYQDKLVLLLRFMAAIKLVGVAAAAGLTHWRFSSPITLRPATTYVGALIAMAAAGGLIWSLGGIALGAILFHSGLLVFLVVAWKDDGLRLPVRL